MTLESFRALIPYEKPKFNDNGKYKKRLREEERMTARVSRSAM